MDSTQLPTSDSSCVSSPTDQEVLRIQAAGVAAQQTAVAELEALLEEKRTQLIELHRQLGEARAAFRRDAR